MTSTTPPVGVERRVGQRFAFNLPVSLRDICSAAEGLGFTQDVSSRGAFLFTTMALSEGAEVELTLRMPSEITLGESMRVRCRGRVLRIVNAADNGWKPVSAQTETKLPEAASGETSLAGAGLAEPRSAETKIGVAVCLSGYEYLPETEDGSSAFRRIAALHSPSETERVADSTPGIPRVAVH
jgi:PilZ domain